TGEEVKTIYQNKQQVDILNARTGKAVVKKDVLSQKFDNVVIETTSGYRVQQDVSIQKSQLDPTGNVRIVPRNNTNNNVNTNNNINVNNNLNDKVVLERKMVALSTSV